jgi:hypothetical protein
MLGSRATSFCRLSEASATVVRRYDGGGSSLRYGSHRASVLFAFAVSSLGARHAVPERATSAVPQCHHKRPDAFFRSLVSDTEATNNLRRRLKPTPLNQLQKRQQDAGAIRSHHGTHISLIDTWDDGKRIHVSGAIAAAGCYTTGGDTLDLS